MFLEYFIDTCMLKHPSLIRHLLRLYVFPNNHKSHQILCCWEGGFLQGHHAFVRVFFERVHDRPQIFFFFLNFHNILLFFNCYLCMFFFLKRVFFLCRKGAKVLLNFAFFLALTFVVGWNFLTVLFLFDLLALRLIRQIYCFLLSIEFTKIRWDILELINEA